LVPPARLDRAGNFLVTSYQITSPRGYRIFAGASLSASALAAPAVPPHFFEYLISSARLSLDAATTQLVWQWSCVAAFYFGGLVVGSAGRKRGADPKRDATIKQLTDAASSYAAANTQWKEQFERLAAERDELAARCAELSAERDEFKNRYLQALNALETTRERIRAQAEEEIRLVTDRLAAENAELKRSLAHMCALPEKFMKVLKEVVAHALVVKAVRIALAPERAKDGDPRQHMLRTQMIQKFIELIDYVQSH
jgi:hypothetical protein